MAQLAIRGHYERGKEVIEILEMFGGKSNGNIKGYNDDLYYYIAKDGLIYGSGIEYEELACNYTIFTLEEFLEKFPYKVGDEVIAYAEGCLAKFTIQDIRWNYELNKVEYKICSSWLDARLIMQRFKEELTMEKKSKLINIEPKLVGNECVHFPIPIDMKLEVKDGMCYLYRDCGEHKESKCLQELKEYLDNATPEQLEEDWKELEKFSEVGPVADEYVEQCKENVNTNNSCTRCVYAVDNHCGLRGFTNDFNRLYCSAQNADKLPNGFELQHDGYFSWVDSKPKYPTTYEECCKILNIPFNGNIVYAGHWVYGGEYLEKHLDILRNFQKLYICLNAYWKLAGKEMGLDKPWEPDWNNGYVEKYYIYLKQNEIEKSSCFYHCHFLAFPTKEMLDAFFGNFEDLIKECKELL